MTKLLQKAWCVRFQDFKILKPVASKNAQNLWEVLWPVDRASKWGSGFEVTFLAETAVNSCGPTHVYGLWAFQLHSATPDLSSLDMTQKMTDRCRERPDRCTSTWPGQPRSLLWTAEIPQDVDHWLTIWQWSEWCKKGKLKWLWQQGWCEI